MKYMTYITYQQFEIKAIDGSNLKRAGDCMCIETAIIQILKLENHWLREPIIK